MLLPKREVVCNMQIEIELNGKSRKDLVVAIGEVLDVKPTYLGVPTFKYKIGNYEVDKEAALHYNEEVEGETAALLLEELKSQGFIPNIPSSETGANVGDENKLVIEMPKADFTEQALVNLEKIISSKKDLIEKSLGTTDLKIIFTEDKVIFPWFKVDDDSEKIKAHTHFIAALCTMAKKQKRVISTQKEVKNEKYAFRCFLLRLGFIGDEFKAARKILLANLSGNSAFKNNIAQDKEVDVL